MRAASGFAFLEALTFDHKRFGFGGCSPIHPLQHQFQSVTADPALLPEPREVSSGLFPSGWPQRSTLARSPGRPRLQSHEPRPRDVPRAGHCH